MFWNTTGIGVAGNVWKEQMKAKSMQGRQIQDGKKTGVFFFWICLGNGLIFARNCQGIWVKNRKKRGKRAVFQVYGQGRNTKITKEEPQ